MIYSQPKIKILSVLVWIVFVYVVKGIDKGQQNDINLISDAGGLESGGFILGFRNRREAIEPRDHFHAYILDMDTFAGALKNATKMLEDECFSRSVQQRYISYKSGIGERLEKGTCSFDECEDFIRKTGSTKPMTSSYEHFENMVNFYVFPPFPE